MPSPYRPEPMPSLARKRLVESLEFALRVVHNAHTVNSEDTTKMAERVVEQLDAYLAEQKS